MTRPTFRVRARRAAVAILAATLTTPLVVTPVAASAATIPSANQQLALRYDEPASAGSRVTISGDPFASTTENQIWQQRTLPIGNGSIGATVYGEIGRERLAFNEKTLWTGGPSTSRPGYNGGNLADKGNNGAALRQVQQLFASGQDSAARSLAQSALIGTSTGYGAYQGYAEIGLDYGFDASGATNYSRTLDLETATATVDFDRGGVHYSREFFTSFPDNVLVSRLRASQTGALNVAIDFGFRLGGATNVVDGDTLTVSGQLADNQLKHNAVVKAVPVGGGTVSADGTKLRVAGATEVILYITAGTDYADTFPSYRTGQSVAELAAQVRGRVDAAADDGYDVVRKRHLADYTELFDRVDLRLGSEVSTDPTDDLLARYRASTATPVEKRTLEVLLYQYGRYLGIESSREGTLPANLQGIWADRSSGGPSPVPWGSDYHMNVNLQMNYWPAYSGNLPETATALVDYVDALRAPGRVTAKIYAGVESTAANPENGFTAHTQNTPFGWTTPGWQFTWGWSPAAVPWILQNVYEYYEYTGDETYLRDVIYPMMKEATKYYDQTLVEDPASGRLVASPAYSPEHGPITGGNFYEQQLIWQLYHDVIVAAQTLNVDAGLVSAWSTTRDQLYAPVEIGASGQIKEWFQETTLGSVSGAQAKHRHLSHLLGLFPGDLISAETPEYLEAAKVSLNDRGDAATGWGIAQRLNSWARIGDGDRSLQIIEQLFRTGIYANLFDTHPPFQIDGNFGYTGGVNEMLMQSNVGYVSILPALPAGWSSGSVHGLLARGDFELGLDWSDGRATRIAVTSRSGGTFVANYGGIALATVKDANGAVVSPTVIDQDRISFPTTAGQTYVITGLPPAGTFAATPTGVQALRSGDETVEVRWADGGENTTFRVERSTDDGDFETIAAAATGTAFVDDDAPVAQSYRYRVSATLGGFTTRHSVAVQVLDIRGVGFVDDRSPRLTYTGGWANYDHAQHYNGTIKLIEQAAGGESISLVFAGTGVSFVSPRFTSFTSVDFYIDGAKVNATPYSLYATAYQARQETVIVDDLPQGVHELKVVVTGAASPAGGRKIEFDGLRVLDTTVVPVDAIALQSKTGALAIGAAGGTLPLTASVEPADATNTGVVWSSSDTSVATVDQNGVVTGLAKNGTVTITATAADMSGVTGTTTVRVFGDPATLTTVDDASPSINYSAGWKVWNQDARNLNSTLHYVDDVEGAVVTYAFTGTGIDVYGTKNDTNSRRTWGAFIVAVDGVDRVTVALNDSPDAHQVLLASITGLTNGAHTVTVRNARAAEGGLKAEFDYFVVRSPLATADERAALQTQLERAAALDQSAYPSEEWASFAGVLATVVPTMNDENATEAQLQSAVDDLRDAIDGLG
ncbi:MAG TPA: glycoside hydrolase N-terminal domain-containing protein [Arachnia sp.]|nr:glycoside hydrolase N-terminal domain-containing protein [Arachnia sp.]HMT85818.1 glycoside hydrolase N-terminal domain-containing protein [Arachnia sp.]